MQKRATLKNIAQKAGVSSAAVSIILNDKPSRVSQEKKDEVKRIAKELNYIPNQIARRGHFRKDVRLEDSPRDFFN